jgi:hypothetical protein
MTPAQKLAEEIRLRPGTRANPRVRCRGHRGNQGHIREEAEIHEMREFFRYDGVLLDDPHKEEE